MSKRNKKSPERADDMPKIETVDVEIDPKLEERIFNEADNDFYDDKRAKDIPPKSIYRSKAFQKWEQEREDDKNAKSPVPPAEPKKLSHAEKAGIVIAVLMLIYAFATSDKPLFFMALSLMVHFIRPAVGAMFGKHNQAAQNALRTFSFVLFAGAVLFLFMG